jgi:small ligand-binding sensory domain FIST
MALRFNMRFVSYISDSESSEQAIDSVIDRARDTLDGKIDIVYAFLTAHHAGEAETILEKLWLELDPQVIVGCAGEGVIGEGREIERAPGLAILVGETPNVILHPFHIAADEWSQLLAEPADLAQRMGCGPQTRAVIGFGDPFTTPVTELMNEMDRSMRGIPLIGGMASAARGPGDNVLMKNDCIYHDGLVGVSLSGYIRVQTLVSQGCSPIGRPLVVTRAHDNVIEQLGGKPALAALSEIVSNLPREQQHLINERGLMIGRAISEYKEQFSRGDFLVRALSGADRETGAIGVGDLVRIGQTVQFHVHDAKSAHEDLELLLSSATSGDAPAAALLFDCNGRGKRLFAQPNHDIAVAAAAMPNTAVAGFFAAGEIGPVGGKNFIHGHTASFALLRPGA